MPRRCTCAEFVRFTNRFLDGGRVWKKSDPTPKQGRKKEVVLLGEGVAMVLVPDRDPVYCFTTQRSSTTMLAIKKTPDAAALLAKAIEAMHASEARLARKRQREERRIEDEREEKRARDAKPFNAKLTWLCQGSTSHPTKFWGIAVHGKETRTTWATRSKVKGTFRAHLDSTHHATDQEARDFAKSKVHEKLKTYKRLHMVTGIINPMVVRYLTTK